MFWYVLMCIISSQCIGVDFTLIFLAGVLLWSIYHIPLISVGNSQVTHSLCLRVLSHPFHPLFSSGWKLVSTFTCCLFNSQWWNYQYWKLLIYCELYMSQNVIWSKWPNAMLYLSDSFKNCINERFSLFSLGSHRNHTKDSISVHFFSWGIFSIPLIPDISSCHFSLSLPNVSSASNIFKK